MYSFEIEEHASCCGVKHFCSFTDNDGYNEYSRIASGLADIGDNILAEITLTNSQMRGMPDAVADMVAAGFVLVLRFRNSNSGNIVNVFHHAPTSEPINQAPGWNGRYSVVAGADHLAVAPPQAAPAVVHNTFHNVYRGGRIGGGYNTLEEARAARRGHGAMRMRTFFSDGTRTEADV